MPPFLCGRGLILGLLSPVWACTGPAFSSENLFQTCFVWGGRPASRPAFSCVGL
ncbi:MAG: hypothetical protein ACK56F_09090 [bacterium]